MKKIIAVIIFLFAAMALVYGLCPRPDINTFIPYSNAYFDNSENLLRLTLAEDERYRLPESLDNISAELIEASLLYEDQNFYNHIGVDFKALLRAFWVTYITKERRVGASTITMQVARMRWDLSSKTITGKIVQILRALQLTRHYSRQEILEVYFNLAPYGRNIEGIAAASLIYFNKKPGQLSLPEALTLAVIPQNPNKRNPTTTNGYENILVARDSLFKRWLEYHPGDIHKSKYLELALKIRPPEKLPFKAPHFTQYIAAKKSVWENGYIDTSLNIVKQIKIEQLVKNYTALKSANGIKNASVLLLNYETMMIEAMVGSADFFNEKLQGQVNGVSAKRSPGSTLKPFVYAMAIDEGLIHPHTLLKDSPTRFAGFTPENYDKKFLGPISAKQALIQSRNVPAVKLQSKLKQKSFYQFLKTAGINGLKEEEHYGLSLALGGGEVTMLELAKLYAALANNGELKSLLSYAAEEREKPKRILSLESSFLVLDILKDNPPPNELGLDVDNALDNEVAWKTGTSWAFRDAWAIGVSGPYVALVWVGNFDSKGNAAFIGRSAAGPLLFSIFKSINPDTGWTVSNTIEARNLNIKKLPVCSTTGDLYEKNCPTSIDSWFIPGVSPIKVSNVYRSIPIDIKTGQRACRHHVGVTEYKVFEFWPSDFLHIFNQAGISLKTPPQYSEGCELGQKSASGQHPIITSPQSLLEYVITINSDSSRQIPLKAIADPDVTKLYWFIDRTYVGDVSNGETLLWNAKPGNFRVRVVDDLGRGASKSIVVNSVSRM